MVIFSTVQALTTEDGEQGYNVIAKLGNKKGYSFHYNKEDAIEKAKRFVNNPTPSLYYFDSTPVI